MSAPTLELLDALFRDKVRAARDMTPGQRLLSGPELFDFACRVTKAGIRCQHPDADEERVMQLLRGRLELGRRLEASQ